MKKTKIPSEILERITWTKTGNLYGDFDVIENIKPIPTACEDCGIRIENRRVQIRFHDYPQKHYRKKCMSCKLYFNPESARYELESKEVLPFYRRYFKEHDK